MDLAQERHEMLQGTAETIYRPRRNHVELAPRCVLEHAVEGRTLVPVLSAADAMVADLLHGLPGPALSHGQQLAALVLHALPVGRYASVDGDALCFGHWCSSFLALLAYIITPTPCDKQLISAWPI